MGKLSNGICILLGFLAMVMMAFVPSAAPLNKSGRFDIFTELYILITKDSYLLQLKEYAKEVYETGETKMLPKDEVEEGTKITNDMTKHLMDDSGAGDPMDEEANTSEDAAAENEEEIPDTTSAAVHESTISAVSEVGPEDPLPEESGEKPFGESVREA